MLPQLLFYSLSCSLFQFLKISKASTNLIDLIRALLPLGSFHGKKATHEALSVSMLGLGLEGGYSYYHEEGQFGDFF